MRRGPVSNFERRHSMYEPEVLKKVNYISTESEWARDRVLEIAPNADITVCDYAVEPIFYSINRELTDEPSCLISCSNAKIKNIPLAINAFSCPELRHVKLYLAGADENRYPNLPSNIIPLGKLNREELAKAISKCWCLIHPSLADTGPTAVKEARVAGMPVILTSECGAKRYISHEKSGYIIQPNNIQELIKSVLSVTESKQKASDMGLYNINNCRLALSVNTMYMTFSNLYKKILSF